MQIHINPSGELSIFRQIVRQITDAIVGGRVQPGEKLPSHRDLAAEIVVAPLTVKKAYDLLEREGLIESQRGRGTFVKQHLPTLDRAAARARLESDARRLLVQARVTGMSHAEVSALLKDIWKDIDS